MVAEKEGAAITCRASTRAWAWVMLNVNHHRGDPPPPAMPHARAARASIHPNISSSRYTNDDGDDTEPEEDAPTPRPVHRTASKKRLSDVYAPDHDESFTSDPGRVPLQSVNMNDDMAEKRRRRKSAKVAMAVQISEPSEAGPSSEGATAEQGSADAPTGATAHARTKQQLLSVAQAPIINVPLDVMSSNFEEWMKMATDNVRRPSIRASIPPL